MPDSGELGDVQIQNAPEAKPLQDLDAIYDVFVSYESQDSAVANSVVMTLERQGFNCWIAPRNVTPGALYADEIVRAINAAKVLVLVLSQTAIESPHVRKEIERASSKGRPIITLKVDATSLTTALEYFLSESQWVDLTVDGSEVAFAKLLVAVRRHLMPVPVMQQRGKATARSAERPTHPSSAAKPNRRLGRPLVVVALAAIVIVVCMTLQIHAAISSRNIVVEPFEVSPTLSGRGETGTVIASAVLDELKKLQNATPISAALAASAGIDSSKRGLELGAPDTGTLLGEIYRLIENRFGHDIRITGSLIETDTGALLLTVRGDRVAPKSMKGPPGELSILSTDAAEYIYAQSQPTLWVKYLSNHKRYAEEIAFAKDAVVNGEQANRPYFLTFWAHALIASGGSKKDARRLLREALTLKPDYWTPYAIISSIAVAEGDEEGAWRIGEQLRNVAGGRPGRAPAAAFTEWDALTWNLSERLLAIEREADLFGGQIAIQSDIAAIQALRHDPDAAELALNSINTIDGDPSVAAETHWVRGVLALDSGDNKTAMTEMESFGAALLDPSIASSHAQERCWIAPAEEAAGRSDKADAVLRAGGSFVDCYRFRADILERRGEWAAALTAYTQAVALAPDLPAGYYSWGVALLRHGDLAGAEVKLKAANERGRHWADPLKTWGDLLVKQAKTSDALGKYEEALKYAPNWAALKEARDAVMTQRP
jgi:tetratricopeptide (TPR) repeat protein